MPTPADNAPDTDARRDDERDAWLKLTLTPQLGNAALRQLLSQFGSPQAVLSASPAMLRQHLPEKQRHALQTGHDVNRFAQAQTWLQQPNRYLLTLADTDYPELLLQAGDPPPVLYLQGRRELLQRPMLAVVGSRHASPQGVRDACAFAHALADAGLTIVSGMALGIDAAAHEGGLMGAASTIAVTGTGLDIVYPARNRQLAHRIADHGLILSEFPPGTPAMTHHFPRRNRIISGLAKGCLVVEATLHSGSLITARLAAEQGREVFAVPGSIHSPFSRGCHALIRQGAKLVESAQDILDELHLQITAPIYPQPTIKEDAADVLWAKIGHAPFSLDDLIHQTGLTASELSAMLLEKELAGQITALPGALYQRIF